MEAVDHTTIPIASTSGREYSDVWHINPLFFVFEKIFEKKKIAKKCIKTREQPYIYVYIYMCVCGATEYVPVPLIL